MSIKVMTAVWDHSQHKGSELLLLLALADFAHDDGGNAFPSVKTMKEKTRLSERAVQYLLRALVASGELAEDGKHPSGTTRYRIVVAALGGAKIAPVQRTAAGGATDGIVGVQPTAPDPSVNHQESSEVVNPVDRLLRSVARSGPGRR